MKAFLVALLTIGVLACGSDDGDGDSMAREAGSACIFTPGEYVLTYRVLQATASCEDVEALADEYLTVTSNGTLVSTSGSDAPTGCVDGNAVRDGCYGAFERNCLFDTTFGYVDITVGAQLDYAAGGGQVTYIARAYSGTTLLDTCTVNMSATINRL